MKILHFCKISNIHVYKVVKSKPVFYCRIQFSKWEHTKPVLFVIRCGDLETLAYCGIFMYSPWHGLVTCSMHAILAISDHSFAHKFAKLSYFCNFSNFRTFHNFCKWFFTVFCKWRFSNVLVMFHSVLQIDVSLSVKHLDISETSRCFWNIWMFLIMHCFTLSFSTWKCL